jgi:hypothetical protein
MLANAGAKYDIYIAARGGLVDRVEELVDKNPGLVHEVNREGKSALYVAACVYGWFEQGEAVADFLLQRGAAPDIYVASTLGLVDRVHSLLEQEPTLSKQRFDGHWPLDWAVRPRRRYVTGNQVKIVDALLQQVQTSMLETLLHFTGGLNGVMQGLR